MAVMRISTTNFTLDFERFSNIFSGRNLVCWYQWKERTFEEERKKQVHVTELDTFFLSFATTNVEKSIWFLTKTYVWSEHRFECPSSCAQVVREIESQSDCYHTATGLLNQNCKSVFFHAEKISVYFLHWNYNGMHSKKSSF